MSWGMEGKNRMAMRTGMTVSEWNGGGEISFDEALEEIAGN